MQEKNNGRRLLGKGKPAGRQRAKPVWTRVSWIKIFIS